MTFNPNKITDISRDENISDQIRESIIAKHSETPEGRARLAVATFNPAQTAMEMATNDPLLVDHVDRMIVNMERIQGIMTGEEEYDKRKFSSLLEGLQMLSDEIKGKNLFKRL